MKKTVLILALLFSGLSSLMGYSYAKKCEKCIEYAKKQKNFYPSIGIAHRDFDKNTVEIDGKLYAWYVCSYGHNYLVCLDD